MMRYLDKYPRGKRTIRWRIRREKRKEREKKMKKEKRKENEERKSKDKEINK